MLKFLCNLENISCSYSKLLVWLLHQHTAKTENFDEHISPNMYECLMNPKYMCRGLEKLKSQQIQVQSNPFKKNTDKQSFSI